MLDDRAGLVMLDLDCRPSERAISGPFDMAGNDVFRPLQPFEANHRGRAAAWFAMLNTSSRELINLIPRHGVLGQFYAGFHRDARPRIRNVLGELLGIEPVNDAPRLATQRRQLLAAPQSLALRRRDEAIIKLISR